MKYVTKNYINRYRLLTLIGQLKAADASEGKFGDKQYGKLYAAARKEFLENAKTDPVYSGKAFDEKYAKKLFEEKIKYNGKLLEFLPASVYGQFKNVEFIKIGYCSKEELKILKDFYNSELSDIEKIAESVREHIQIYAIYLLVNYCKFQFSATKGSLFICLI